MALIKGILKNASGVRPNTKIILIAQKTSASVIQHAPDFMIVTDASGAYSFECNSCRYQLIIMQAGCAREQVGYINVYDDSLTGTLEQYLTEWNHDDLTPDVVARVEALEASAKQSAINADNSAKQAQSTADKTSQQVIDAGEAQVTEATKQAVLAKASADKAKQVTGLDTVAEAVQTALADSYQYAMTKADFGASREANKALYAGSGCLDNPVITTTEQDGSLLFPATTANAFTQCKTKKVIDGVMHYIDKSDIRTPNAPNGTKSYDSSTGIVTDHLTYLDPKYNNTPALSHNDAVSRCFEGLIKNGDFRLGAEGWSATNATFDIKSGGMVHVTGTSSVPANQVLRNTNSPLTVGAKYEIRYFKSSSVSGSGAVHGGLVNSNNYEYSYTTETGWINLTLTATRTTGSIGFMVGNTPGRESDFKIEYLRPVTSAPILTRQDLGFVEINPSAECTVFKPLGNKQYGATTADGITLKKLTDLGIPQSESAFGEWDKKTVGYGELVSSLTDAQLKTVLSNPKNNIRFDPITNKLVQSEYKIRVEEGVNDTDTLIERMTKLGYTQDKTDVTLWKRSDGRQAITLFLRQTYNQGAGDKTYNPFGMATFSDGKPWYLSSIKPTSAKDCFINAANGSIASGKSGSILAGFEYYDDVCASQIKDLRLSAHKQDVNKLRVDAERKAEAGEARGWGKVPFTKVATQTSPTVSSNSMVSDIPFGSFNIEVGNIVSVEKADGTYHTSTVTEVGNSSGFIYFRVDGITRIKDGKLVVMGWLTPQADTLGWTDIIGSPENIAATFKDGCVGMWAGIATTDKVKLTRKANSSPENLRTIDNGVSWDKVGQSLDTVSNEITNGGATVDSAVTLEFYPTLSNFTEAANNSVVIGEVGDVTVTTRHEVNQGNRLHNSVLGSIGKDTNNVLTKASKTKQTVATIEHVPHGFTAPANESTGCKVATSIIEKDGLLYSQYQAIEIVNNGTDWGDTSNAIPVVNGDATHTDDNGKTVKVVNHIGMIPLGIASYSDSSQSTK